MSETETTESFDTTDQQPPPPAPVAIVVTDEPAEPRPEPPRAEAKPAAKPPIVIRKGGARVDGHGESNEIRAIQIAEDASIRQMLEQLGTNGAFQVVVHRIEPEEVRDPSSGRVIKTSGMLKKYTEVVDEDLIKRKHGGGRYRLDIQRATGKGEQMVKFRSRSVEIAGEPNLEDPALSKLAAPARTESAVAAPAPSAESEKVASRALDMAERMVERAQQGAAPPDNRAYEMMIQAMREQIAAQHEEMRELRRQMSERSAQPPANPVENKLLDKLIDQDSARVNAMRMQHDSEIRMLKENAAEDAKRAEARFDRLMADMKASFEREIASLKSHQEILRLTISSSSDAQIKVLEGQIRALEREINAKDKELAELRAKKDKGPVELAKDFKAIQEAFGKDEDDEDESTVGKIMGALPDVLPQVGAMFGKGPAAQPPVQQPQVQAPKKPAIVKGPDGERYVVRGGQLVPLKPKVQTVPGEPQIPVVAPERLAQVVSYLERAFEGDQDPEVVAQSAKGMRAGQEDLFQGLRAAGGVDAYLSKVANLPSSSPLANQAGKNWLRKLSKALVGE